MSERGEVAEYIKSSKDMMKKVERVVQSLLVFYKTESMPEAFMEKEKERKRKEAEEKRKKDE